MPMPITNGVTFTSFSFNFVATAHGSLSQDSKPSVMRIMKFLLFSLGKSAAAASRDRAIGVAPFAVIVLIFCFIFSVLLVPKGTSSFVSLQS